MVEKEETKDPQGHVPNPTTPTNQQVKSTVEQDEKIIDPEVVEVNGVKYKVQECRGSGGFGKIYLVQAEKSSFALKVQEKIDNCFKRELEAYKKVSQHPEKYPHIAKYIASDPKCDWGGKKCPVLVLEHYKNGPLDYYVK